MFEIFVLVQNLLVKKRYRCQNFASAEGHVASFEAEGPKMKTLKKKFNVP